MSNEKHGIDRLKASLDILATVALISTCGVILWAILAPRAEAETTDTKPEPSTKRRPEVAIPTEAISLQGAVTIGSPTAKIGIMEFSEFQCPFCSKFSLETMPEIRRRYIETGLVRLAFRNLPLERIHRYAFGAGELAQCSDEQGRFWEVHDAFFKRPAAGSAEEFRARALGTGVNVLELDRCIKAGRAAQKMRDDLKLAASLSLTGTPAFLIGTLDGSNLRVLHAIVGARPVTDFKQAIDSILNSSASSEVRGK
jgi:protein-disulfide isomerase